MYTLCGHEDAISCLSSLPNNSLLASSSLDNNIKLWDLSNKRIISTLSHKKGFSVIALCYVNREVVVSGLIDKSLVVWGCEIGLFIYKPLHVLTGHTSSIKGILRINGEEIISGEFTGNMRIWNIRYGICIKYILIKPDYYGNLIQIKLFGEGNSNIKTHTNTNIRITACTRKEVSVWEADNFWGFPDKEFKTYGYSFELFSQHLILRGGVYEEIEFIDYTHNGNLLSPTIAIKQKLVSDLVRVPSNIVVSVSLDG